MRRDIVCFAVFHPESIFKYPNLNPNPNPNTHTHTHTHIDISIHPYKHSTHTPEAIMESFVRTKCKDTAMETNGRN